MMRARILFAVYLLAALAGGLLYHTSYAVDEQKSQLSRINRDIIAEQQNIQVLGAEWTYLTEPKRIEALAQKYLHMEMTKTQHVASVANMPSLFGQSDKPVKTAAVAPVKVDAPVAVATATPAPVAKPVLAAAHPVVTAQAVAPSATRVLASTTSTATPPRVKLLLASFQPGRVMTRE